MVHHLWKHPRGDHRHKPFPETGVPERGGGLVGMRRGLRGLRCVINIHKRRVGDMHHVSHLVYNALAVVHFLGA